MYAFLICGYGIPKNIATDPNYSAYLNIAFNQTFAHARDQAVAIVPCGGPTELEPPYEGTEAAAIGKYFEELMRREAVREATKDWKVILEDRSLSTLENLVLGKERLEMAGEHGPVTLFCEQTRVPRIQVVSERVFGVPCQVVGIDFDVSPNRYLDAEIIKQKEARELEHSLAALRSPETMAEHHAFFERKFAYFRAEHAKGVPHTDIVEAWYRMGANG